MIQMKNFYQRNIYGLMGTLVFHILLFSVFLLIELKTKDKIEIEETVILDFAIPEIKKPEPEVIKNQSDQSIEKFKQSLKNAQSSGSNLAVNDAAAKDKFFDSKYQQEIEDAKNLISNVNRQLSKKPTSVKKYEMPEATSEGKNPEQIKNIIYSGKSNIHYFLENRYHLRLPIPVYLAKGGGTVIVDILVNRKGEVIKAQARSSSSIQDAMLPTYATQAAENTLFNEDHKAPEPQKGTITYNFVSQ